MNLVKLAGRLGTAVYRSKEFDSGARQGRWFEELRNAAADLSALTSETEYGSMILGSAGDDLLRGSKGPDRVIGRAGEDRLFGGAENDKLFGEADDDALFGGAGRDRLKGGDGADRLFGGRGADRIFADGADKLIRAGSGRDKVIVELSGEMGQMTRLFGGAGIDLLVLEIDYDSYGPDLAAGVLADLAALETQIETGKKGAIALRTLGIKVKGFEQLVLRETGERPLAAADDLATTGEDDPVVFFPMANDAGAAALARIDGQIVQVGDIVSLALGLLELGQDGAVKFTPNGVSQRLGDGDKAEDSFTYQAVSAGGVLGPEATVRIVITGASDPIIILPDEGVPQSGASGAPLKISGVAIDLPQNESGVIDVVISTEDGEIAFTEDTDTSNLTLIDNDGTDGEIAFSGAPDDVTEALANSLQFTSVSGFAGVARINVTANDTADQEVKIQEIIEIPIDLTDAPPALDLNGAAPGASVEALYRPERGAEAFIGDAARITDPNGTEISAILIKSDAETISGDQLTLVGGLALRMEIVDDFNGFGPALASLDRRPRSIEDFEEALALLRFMNTELEAAGAPLDPSDIRLVDRVISLRAVDPEGNIGPGVNATIDVEQNLPPVIVPLNISIDEDMVFQGNLIATDPNGDDLSFALSPDKPPQKGNVSVSKEGVITYQPRADANGEDNFIVLVSDGDRTSAELVTVNITPVNDAPVLDNRPFDLPLTGLLTAGLSAKDPENEPLIFSLVDGGGPSKGEIDLQPDGNFTYRVNFLEPGGVDEFTFTVSDGEVAITEVARINVAQGVDNFAFPDFFTITPDGGGIGATLVENDRSRIPTSSFQNILVFDGLETVDGFESVAGEGGPSLLPVSVEVTDPRNITILTELGGEVLVRSRGAVLNYTPPETFVDENGVERDITSLAPGEEIIDRFAYRLSGQPINSFPVEEPFSTLTPVEITIRQPDATPVLDLNGALDGVDGAAIYQQREGAQAIIGDDIAITDDDSEVFAFVRLTLSNSDGDPDEGGALSLSAEIAETFDLVVEDEASEIATVYRLELQTGESASAAAFQAALQGLVYENSIVDAGVVTAGSPPDLRDRVIETVISDGELLSASAILTIVIDPVDPPALDLNGNDAGVDSFARYRPGEGLQDIFGDPVRITSEDNGPIDFISLSLSFADGDEIDILSQLVLDDFTSAQFGLSFNGIADGDAIYRLAALDGEGRSAGAFGGALRGVEFINLGLDNPDAAIDLGLTPDFTGREVEVQAFDIFGGSNIAVVEISSVPNIPPSLQGAGGRAADLTPYLQGEGAQAIFPDTAQVIDPDSETLEALTLSLTTARVGGDIFESLIDGDRLELIGLSTGQFTLDGPTFDANPFGVIGPPLSANYTLRPLSGAASPEAFEAALKDLHFFSQAVDDQTAADPADAARLFAPRLIGLTLSDGVDLSERIELALSVSPNIAPTLTTGSFATDEDQPLLGQLMGADREDRPITFVLGDQGPGAGEVELTPDGAFTYTPDPNVFGDDSFMIELSDGFNTVVATVTVTVAPVNDAPVAEDLSVTAVESATVADRVVATDVEGDDLIFTSTSEQAPTSGSLTLDADGAFSFTPEAGFIGDITFGFTVDDQNGGVDEGVVTLTYTADPSGLQPQPDAAMTDEDVEVLIDVLANDDLAENATVTLSVAAGPTFGEVVVQGDQILYRPGTDASGQDSFSYRIVGDQSGAATQTVTVDLAPVADVPTLAISPTLTSDDGFASRQRVNDGTAFDQDQPQILKLASGHLFYVYRVADEVNEGPHIAFRFGTVEADGSITFSAEHIIPDEGDGAAVESRPQAIQLDSGEVLVAWESLSADGSHSGVRIAPIALTQTDGAAPLPVIGEIDAVNQDVAVGHSEIQIAQLASNDILFTWTHAAIDEDAGGVAARLGQFNPAFGFTFGEETRVNDVGAQAQSQPKAVELPDGRLLFIWRSDVATTDGDGSAIVARIATIGAGDTLSFGDEILINQTTAGDQAEPDVAVLSTGDLVFVWDDGQAVRSRIGELDGAGALVLNDEFVASLLSPVEVHRSGSVIETTPGRILYTWVTDAVGEPDIFDAFYRFGDLDGSGGVNFEIEDLVHDATRFANEETVTAVHLGNDEIAFVWASNDSTLEPGDEIGSFGVATRTFDPANVSGQFLQLSLSSMLGDQDGSEALDRLEVTGAPDGFQFRRGAEVVESNGVAPLGFEDLEASETLAVFAPADFTGDITLTLSLTSVETANGDSATAERAFFQSYVDGAPFIFL